MAPQTSNPSRDGEDSGRLCVRDLGRRAYAPVHEEQKALVEQRYAGEIPDTLLLVEHEHVYTLGRNAREENILASAEHLAKLGIDVERIGRGGDVTYHGPGQLVGYPILNLRELGHGVLWHVEQLEACLIRVLDSFGVAAGTDPINRGVWVGKDKIAALGVRVTRHITMHGFALNVDPDMSYYQAIVPCGIRDRGVTSLARLRPDVTMADVKGRIVEVFQDQYGYADVVTADDE